MVGFDTFVVIVDFLSCIFVVFEKLLFRVPTAMFFGHVFPDGKVFITVGARSAIKDFADSHLGWCIDDFHDARARGWIGGGDGWP